MQYNKTSRKKRAPKLPAQRETVAIMRSMSMLYGLPPESERVLVDAENALKWGTR